MSIGIPGEPTEFGNGDWSLTDVLTLRLTGADAEWDFDDDGAEDPAKLNLTLSRS